MNLEPMFQWAAGAAAPGAPAGPAPEAPSDGDLLDAYSRAVVGVAEAASPAVVNIGTLHRLLTGEWVGNPVAIAGLRGAGGLSRTVVPGASPARRED